ncbi:MAG: glycoside hydrolase family 2, partial [Rhodanobacteraceae bacterium]
MSGRCALWVAGLLVGAVPVAFAGGATASPSLQTLHIDGGAGHATPISGWAIQSSAKAQQGGEVVSQNGYVTKDWYPVTGRATVMAGLLENGHYPDIFHGLNLQTVQVPDANDHRFVIPWWYRTQFVLPTPAKNLHTFVRTNGIIPGADLWLNGHQIATRAEIEGAFPVHMLDVTRWVHAGVNTLAMFVYPADPQRDLSMGWVDWNPTPPDNNMGPWRGVDIVQTGPVVLGLPGVTSALSLPDLASATLDVKVEVRNLEDTPIEASVDGTVAGIALHRVVRLAPRQAETVAFSPQTDPALKLAHPKVWWPVGMGGHPLYDLALVAKVGDAVSDRSGTSFGIRSVGSRLTRQGYRQFIVNGKPVLIRGAGWSPDMFLRDRPERMADEFSYVRNLGLNAIRTEGMLEDQYFYDLADRDGIMILPGWQCCNKWEAAAGTGAQPWNAADAKLAEESMASEARLLRNHPSVIGFLIGSDNAPPSAVARMYVDTLRGADWPDPVIAAAAEEGTQETGPSGLKMRGPYAWVPPSYWYADKLGGAFGFDSEVSAGADIPLQADLQRMLGPQELEALWKYPDVLQFHATSLWSPFASLKLFDAALARRYGAPRSLADYVAKAQLDNYDNVRAQFEAFNAHMSSGNPSTGVIYWMLNNAWPSLHWHLFDYYMNPAGAYFGAKKANEPMHIQYSYDTRVIVLVNHTPDAGRGLRARIRVRDLKGGVRYSKVLANVDVPANRAIDLAT